MFKSILKIIFIISFLFNFIFCNSLYAGSDVKMAILPFSVDAQQDHEKLKNKIPQLLSEKLQEEGIKILLLSSEKKSAQWRFSEFRKLGIKTGVDYILTGSLFIAGESISIDAKLVSVYEEQTFTSLYADAMRLEELFAAVTKLSREITGEIFQQQIITDITVTGNKRVEADAIMRIIETEPGDLVKPENISRDLRKIYAMGYFDNVVVEKQALDKGVKLNFHITEKSTVRKVKFKGNRTYKDEELQEIVNTKTGSILNIHKINSDVDQMRAMYTQKNYHNCSINYKVIPLEHSQADIVFTFEEGKKIKVEEIVFKGNRHFSDKDLKKIMKTNEKGFFSFLSSSGNLNDIEVRNDVIRIESYYKNNGFIDAKVSDPEINIGEKSISIRFNIHEGSQYKIKTIDIKGDLIASREELFENIQSKKGELYNRENIRKDIHTISDIYSNRGYANVNISPVVDKIEQDKVMSITYSITKGEPVYFNRVNISGNLKTRDKVIRREIKVVEQDLYSKENIQKSYKNLNRLNYFSQIEVQPVKTAKKNEMDLDIKVVEKETGSFSVGGGVSTAEGGFASGSIQERNLFGRGQTLKFEATFSEERALYNISFFEPYVMDSEISGGVQLYKEDKEFDYYDKEAFGLTLKLGYTLYDYVKIGINYNLEDYKTKDIQADKTYMTEGEFLTSNIQPYIQYDSRDDFFLPTEGSKHKLSIEYGGEFLGGDIDYTKYIAETGVFFPLFGKFTGALHAEGGYLDDRSGTNTDIDNLKFYLGGMQSVRGFDKYDINGNTSTDTKDRGGEKYVQFNAEILFPITEEYSVAGVFFYDRGDVYRIDETIDLIDQFSSVGTGIRWNSPVGPIRLEYGWVIEGKNVRSPGDGQFEFSFGAFF